MESSRNWDKTSDTTLYAKWVLKIGAAYQGGVVFYIFQFGETGYISGETHGLIAATADLSTGLSWFNESYITIRTNTALGTGQANTTAIVNAQGSGNYAAQACNAYTNTDKETRVEYDDWFLPSKDELALMYDNLKMNGLGGFSDWYYWSSSEYDDNNAWLQYFDDGYQYGDGKHAEIRVRPVRAF
jgi:hypothetical protein